VAQQLLLLQVDGSPGAQPRGIAGLGAAIRSAEGRVLLWRSGTAPARPHKQAD
jgi:hypothetical protein